MIMCDRAGIISEEEGCLNGAHAEIAKVTNRGMLKGKLADALKGADVFIGVSAANLVTPEMVKSMARDSIVFPMANPVPEIMPDLALEA